MPRPAASIFPSSLAHIPVQKHSTDWLSLQDFNPDISSGRKELVLLEAGLTERQVLLDGVPAGMAVAVLGGAQDGLQQLAHWSASHADLDALHLVCHGAPGRLMLGARTLDRQALADPQVQETLAAIGLSLRPGAALLLYSCNVAEGAEGQTFVADLARALGVPVAASASTIGAGNWALEYASAAISATPLAWSGYAPTLTIANNLTDFATIGTSFYANTSSGFSAGTVISKSDIASTGWDVAAQSSATVLSFSIRGASGVGYGDGDNTSLRFFASDIDYVTFKSNANGFYFDLTQFAVRNNVNASLSVQALDATGNAVGSSVPFNITASTAFGGAFTQISLADNNNFVHIYGFKVSFTTASDAPFFDNIIVANIGTPSFPTTVVSTAQLSLDTGSNTSDFITSSATQTISGTLSAALVDGEQVQVSFDNGATWSSATTFATGANLWSTTTTLAGSGTFKARVATLDGSTTPYSHSYTLDNTAPAAPSTPDLASANDSGASNTDNITTVNQPSFSGTAESGSTVTLYEGNTVLGSATASGGNWTIVPNSALSAGSHEITVKAVDAAGNVSTASTALTVNVDASAPTGLTLSATTAQVASATPGAALATLSSTDANAVTYALANGNGSNDADNAAFTISGNSLNVSGTQLSAGDYHIYLSATDAAGNVSYLAQTMTVQNIPQVTSIVRAGGASGTLASAASSVDYTVTFSESVTGVDITDFVLTTSGNASGTISAISGSGSTYTVTVNSLSGDGTLRLDLQPTGTGIQNGSSVAINAGYSAGQTYTLDHSAPAAPSVPVLNTADDTGSSNSDNITTVSTPTLSGSAEADSTVTLYDGATVLGTAVATGGVWSITASTLAQGAHTLTVKASDAAGNVSAASSALTLTVDTAAVAPTSLALSAGSDSGTTGDGITKFASPTITGAGEADAAITLYDTDGTTVIGSTTAGANGTWSIVVNTTLSEGAHTLKAGQTDLAGNASVLSTGLALTIDTQAPAAPGAPTLAPSSDTGTQGDNHTLSTTPVIKGTALANAVVKLYATNGTTVLGTTTADGSGNWSITSSNLSVGVHTLTAKQQDVASNESVASAALSLTIDEPPVEPVAPPLTDGVAVESQTITLAGGGSGTQIVVPVVTPGREETNGNANLADIPLATLGQENILLAQLPTGFGLTSVGGVSLPASDAQQSLITAITAAVAGHTNNDQSQLTGNGSDFLSKLPQSTPLLVQTITPTATTAPSGTLTLTGTSSELQRTALVIDTTHLPAGSKLALNAVDFAAIIGSASISINSSGQVVTGDAANQTFTVAAANNSSIFAGGGSDTLVFGQRSTSAATTPLHAASVSASSTTLLHGGLGNDVAVFTGNKASYNIEQHEGYLLVSAKAQPQQKALLVNIESMRFIDANVAIEHRDVQMTIAGLYQEVLHRQADYLGLDFWASAEKNGTSLGKIALAMIMSPESQALNQAAFNGNNGHDIELLYQSIFHRQGDAEGLAFWSNAMKNGLSLEGVANSFMLSDEMTLHKIGVAEWNFQMG